MRRTILPGLWGDFYFFFLPRGGGQNSIANEHFFDPTVTLSLRCVVPHTLSADKGGVRSPGSECTHVPDLNTMHGFHPSARLTPAVRERLIAASRMEGLPPKPLQQQPGSAAYAYKWLSGFRAGGVAATGGSTECSPHQRRTARSQPTPAGCKTCGTRRCSSRRHRQGSLCALFTVVGS